MPDDKAPEDKAPDAPKAPETTKAPEAPKPPPADDGEPAWLGPRLERERAKLLRDLGVDSGEDAKKAISDWKSSQEATKSEVQKLTEKVAASASKVERAKELEDVVSLYAARELGALSKPQQTAVKAIAGDDAAKTLAAIEALKPTWAAKAVEEKAASAAAVAAAAPPAPAATTAPSAKAPPGASASSIDHKAEWSRLKSKNPIAAAAYLNRFRFAVFPIASA